ncbi:MAG: DUF1552 domain-containing protein [Myxococcota bacterium]
MTRSRFLKRRPLSRRTMLRGLGLGGGAVAIGLPVLDAMTNESGTAFADGSIFPQRYVQFVWGNGVLPWFWTPAEEGADYAMTEQLAPLANVREHMSVVTGFDVRVPGRSPHESAVAGMLSGSQPIVEGENVGWAAPSLDQVLAAELGGSTRFRSLQTSIVSNGGSRSVLATGETLPSETSAAALFDRLFGEGFRLPGETFEPDPTLRLRRSVLDSVAIEQQRLRQRLGAEDRLRVEQHLTNVRELERRIARLEEDPPNFEACMRPAMPREVLPDSRGRDDLDGLNGVFADLLIMALACDQTRIVGHVFSPAVRETVYPIEGIDLQGVVRGHHDLTHNEPLDDGSGRGEMWRTNEIVKYIMASLGRFVQGFAEFGEGEGSLLDNTVILGTTDASNPRLHSLDDFPILLFGRAGGRLNTGFHYRSSGDNAARVNLTIARAMGVPLPSFGTEDAFATDSVGALEA